MILADVITEINEKAGFRRDIPKATRALTVALDYLEKLPFLPWFLLSEYEHTFTGIGEERVPVPEEFLKGFEEGEMFYVEDITNKMIPLNKVEVDEATIEYSYSGVSAGVPTHYALTGKYFRVFPTPDMAYKIRMIYYKKSRKDWADVNNVNIWLDEAPRLIIACAAINLMEATRDKTGMEIQNAVRKEESTNLYYRHVERKEVNMDRDRGLN